MPGGASSLTVRLDGGDRNSGLLSFSSRTWRGGEGSVRSTLFNNIFKNRPGSGRGAGNGVHFNISMIYGIYGSCMDR